MKKIIRIIACLAILLPLAIGTQSYTSPSPEPVPAPLGTVISLTNCHSLSGAGYWSGGVYHLYPNRQIKVTFFGARYSDGDDVADPNSPWINTAYGDNHAVQCAQFYYQDGRAVVYSRQSSAYSWVYEGDLFMRSNNCTMDGLKVTVFTVNCEALNNPN